MEHEYKYQALASTGKKVRTAATYMGFINHFCLRFFVLFASLPQPGERVSCLRNVLNIIDFFTLSRFRQTNLFCTLTYMWMPTCLRGGSVNAASAEDVLNLLLYQPLPFRYLIPSSQIFIHEIAIFSLHKFNQLRIHTKPSETKSIARSGALAGCSLRPALTVAVQKAARWKTAWSQIKISRLIDFLWTKWALTYAGFRENQW